jgi:hypothetical protein
MDRTGAPSEGYVLDDVPRDLLLGAVVGVGGARVGVPEQVELNRDGGPGGTGDV